MALEPAIVHDIVLGGAAAVMLLGMWLSSRATGYRMALEERVKDGNLTGDEASRKIRYSQWTGPIVSVIGGALLLYSLLG